jgi:hypothetical protein
MEMINDIKAVWYGIWYGFRRPASVGRRIAGGSRHE